MGIVATPDTISCRKPWFCLGPKAPGNTGKPTMAATAKVRKMSSAAPQMATPINPQIAVLPINAIIADRDWNVREDHKRKPAPGVDGGGYGHLAELKASMEAEGQLTPIIVRQHPKEQGKFSVVAGFRRLTVAGQLGWKTVRAEIRAYDDGEASWINLQENEQRKSLSGYEKSKGYHRQVTVHKWSVEDIAKRALCDKSTIENHVRIMSNAIPEAVDRYKDGTWNFDVLIKLAALSKAVQKELVAALGRRRGDEAVAGINEFKKTGKVDPDAEGTSASGSDEEPTKKKYKPGRSALTAAFEWAKEQGLSDAEIVLGWTLGQSGYGGTTLRLGKYEFSAKKPKKIAASKDA